MKKTLLTLFAITFLYNYSNAQVSIYTFAATTGTFTPITGGTLLGSTTSDEQRFIDPATPLGVFTTVGIGFPIGFNFTYNGITFDRLAINNNGWISLGQSSLAPNSVDINSSSNYNQPLSATSTATPTFLRNRIGGLAMDLQGQTGSSLRIETIGTSPNKICVIQWMGYREYASSGDNFNFQIRLKETSNNIEFVYGTFTTTSTTNAAQVGLSGTLESDYNLRTTTTNWASTTAGTANIDECDVTATVKPASGQTFTWSPPPVCTGTPTAGTASGPSGACSGINFDLVLTGYTPNVSGLTFQWQSSSTLGGTYSNISGAITPTYSTTQTSAMYYKCLVSCSGGTAVASNVVTVALNAPSACYCIPLSGGTSCITNVTLNTTLNHTSTCEASPAYYVAVPSGTSTATLTGGQTYPLSVTIGTNASILSVWIDYNQNGLFEASEWTQIATNALASSTSTVNIVVPSSALAGQTGMRIRSRNTGSPNGAGDACVQMYSGETEDYTITIVAAPACTGTPTAGTASGPSSICNGISFDLVLTGYTSGVSAITLQWQSSSSLGGTYTNINGATSATLSTTETATTYYKCLVSCSGGTAVASNVVTVTLNSPSACYCTPPSTSCTSDMITNVTISTINNTTSCSPAGYGTYTTPTASLNQGISYPISVTKGGSSTEHASVWIDYNQNGIFESTEHTYLGSTSSTSTPITSTITIPGTATLGATRMRVRLKYFSALTGADACLAYSYGETEDYAITIGVGTPCSGTPTVGIASATDTVCSSVDLVLTGYTSGVTGITFQWQSSSTSGGTYTDIAGGTTSTFTTNQSATTYYKCNIACNGGTSVASNVVTVYSRPILDCYCTSTATSTSDEEIYNVTVGTLSNASTCSTTGGTGSVLNKYSNYTSIAAPSLSRTAAIPFTVEIGTCGSGSYINIFKIFIDYDQNGSFAEAGETVFVSDTASGAHTVSGTFYVPNSAATGNTLMRVVCRETSSASSVDSCGTYSWGETEDYLVNIQSLTGINENTISSIYIYPNPTTGLFTITAGNADFTELMISVFDIQGKEVFTVSDKNSSSIYKKQINLEGLSKGLYYIKLNTGNSVKTQKLIIQ